MLVVIFSHQDFDGTAQFPVAPANLIEECGPFCLRPLCGGQGNFHGILLCSSHEFYRCDGRTTALRNVSGVRSSHAFDLAGPINLSLYLPIYQISDGQFNTPSLRIFPATGTNSHRRHEQRRILIYEPMREFDDFFE